MCMCHLKMIKLKSFQIFLYLFTTFELNNIFINATQNICYQRPDYKKKIHQSTFVVQYFRYNKYTLLKVNTNQHCINKV